MRKFPENKKENCERAVSPKLWLIKIKRMKSSGHRSLSHFLEVLIGDAKTKENKVMTASPIGSREYRRALISKFPELLFLYLRGGTADHGPTSRLPFFNLLGREDPWSVLATAFFSFIFHEPSPRNKSLILELGDGTWEWNCYKNMS